MVTHSAALLPDNVDEYIDTLKSALRYSTDLETKLQAAPGIVAHANALLDTSGTISAYKSVIINIPSGNEIRQQAEAKLQEFEDKCFPRRTKQEKSAGNLWGLLSRNKNG
jgi:hypothetical protein